MRGNSHVRFGAGDEETCPGNAARRFIPTLLGTDGALSLSPGDKIGEGIANRCRFGAVAKGSSPRAKTPSLNQPKGGFGRPLALQAAD